MNEQTGFSIQDSAFRGFGLMAPNSLNAES
jgi:hypothetical protein